VQGLGRTSRRTRRHIARTRQPRQLSRCQQRRTQSVHWFMGLDAAHLGISAVSLTLTTTTPCNDANPNVCALSLPVILANYTYTYDSDLPTSWQYHTPCCISSVRREIGALPHLFKEYNTHTSHSHVLLDVGKGRHRCGYGCGCLLMSQAPGQMSLFCAAFLSYHLIYSSSCSF
jgi:hypothetical protein